MIFCFLINHIYVCILTGSIFGPVFLTLKICESIPIMNTNAYMYMECNIVMFALGQRTMENKNFTYSILKGYKGTEEMLPIVS